MFLPSTGEGASVPDHRHHVLELPQLFRRDALRFIALGIAEVFLGVLHLGRDVFGALAEIRTIHVLFRLLSAVTERPQWRELRAAWSGRSSVVPTLARDERGDPRRW